MTLANDVTTGKFLRLRSRLYKRRSWHPKSIPNALVLNVNVSYFCTAPIQTIYKPRTCQPLFICLRKFVTCCMFLVKFAVLSPILMKLRRNSFEIVNFFKDFQKILALQKRVYIESKFPKFDGVCIIPCLYALILTTLPRRGRPHQQVPLRSSFLHG